MHLFRQNFWKIAAISVLLWNTALSPACAAADADRQQFLNGAQQDSQKSFANLSDKDGKDFIEQMVKMANSVNDYSFDFEMNVYKKSGKVVSQKGKFYFKKPRLIRLEIIDGLNEGSEAVMDSSGKVHGHLGGVLSIFEGTLSPYSNYLKSANGYPMVDSDFSSLASALKTFVVSDNKQSRVVGPVDWRTGKKYYVLDLTEAVSTNERRIWKRVVVDPSTYLPVEWFDYKDGKLWTYSFWTNVRLNPGLDDKLFKL